jgi:uncharacterized protein YjcR
MVPTGWVKSMDRTGRTLGCLGCRPTAASMSTCRSWIRRTEWSERSRGFDRDECDGAKRRETMGRASPRQGSPHSKHERDVMEWPG